MQNKFGQNLIFDVLTIIPCTGNTLAKLANNIVDTPVTMAVTSHLRNDKPVVIGICTNDGLGSSIENIGKLLNKKNYFFVPFMQNNPITKPHSIVCDFSLIKKSLEFALDNKQINNIFLKI